MFRCVQMSLDAFGCVRIYGLKNRIYGLKQGFTDGFYGFKDGLKHGYTDLKTDIRT